MSLYSWSALITVVLVTVQCDMDVLTCHSKGKRKRWTRKESRGAKQLFTGNCEKTKTNRACTYFRPDQKGVYRREYIWDLNRDVENLLPKPRKRSWRMIEFRNKWRIDFSAHVIYFCIRRTLGARRLSINCACYDNFSVPRVYFIPT